MCGMWKRYKFGESSHEIRRSCARIHVSTSKRSWKRSRRDHGHVRNPKRS